MEVKITERHIELLYAAKSLFEKQLRNNRKGYEEFRNRTDRYCDFGKLFLPHRTESKTLEGIERLRSMKESFMLISI